MLAALAAAIAFRLRHRALPSMSQLPHFQPPAPQLTPGRLQFDLQSMLRPAGENRPWTYDAVGSQMQSRRGCAVSSVGQCVIESCASLCTECNHTHINRTHTQVAVMQSQQRTAQACLFYTGPVPDALPCVPRCVCVSQQHIPEHLLHLKGNVRQIKSWHQHGITT